MLWAVVGGTLCAFGLVGNALSFVVLHFGGDNSSKTAATTLLLRALAVADSLVLVTYLPLYALESATVYTRHHGVFRRFYMVIMPYLWPLYLVIPYLFRVQHLYSVEHMFSERSCVGLREEVDLQPICELLVKVERVAAVPDVHDSYHHVDGPRLVPSLHGRL